ncbi:MAG: hypothetical protein CM15mP103_11190 [Gammaproteobacteria bacterium]|nr:MAG: hypothetical protein CM15mP103_11190 [Gammaproteobacteria bacterium]
MLVQKGQFRGKQIIGRPILELMTRNHLGDQSLAQMAVGAFLKPATTAWALDWALRLRWMRASGTIGEGDFYWGGLASTLFGSIPLRISTPSL